MGKISAHERVVTGLMPTTAGFAAQRIAIVGSASGSGKTTLARELAKRVGGTFIEVDSMIHGPGWTSVPDDELRSKLKPLVAQDAWAARHPRVLLATRCRRRAAQ